VKIPGRVLAQQKAGGGADGDGDGDRRQQDGVGNKQSPRENSDGADNDHDRRHGQHDIGQEEIYFTGRVESAAGGAWFGAMPGGGPEIGSLHQDLFFVPSQTRRKVRPAIVVPIKSC
jgi:hypothetical protein